MLGSERVSGSPWEPTDKGSKDSESEEWESGPSVGNGPRSVQQMCTEADGATAEFHARPTPFRTEQTFSPWHHSMAAFSEYVLLEIETCLCDKVRKLV